MRRLLFPDKRFFLHVERAEEINIPFLKTSGIKGIAFDTDNTLVEHNDNFADFGPRNLCAGLREAGIDYCVYTYNWRRDHIETIALQIRSKHQVVFTPLDYFDSFTGRLARQMKIQPSRMAVVNDFYPPLLLARKAGCIAIKVKPFETEREKCDSLILRTLRIIDNNILEPHLMSHLSS